MTQHRVPLPCETALRLRIVLLEYELAQLQARLLHSQAESLEAMARLHHTHQQELLLAQARADVPPGVTTWRLDAEQGCLVVEVDGALDG